MTNRVRSKKITEYDQQTHVGPTDLFLVSANNNGTVNSVSVSADTLLGNNQSNIVVSNTKHLSAKNFIIRDKRTPNTSSDTILGGTIFFDNSYLYIATSNNTIKRVSLSSF